MNYTKITIPTSTLTKKQAKILDGARFLIHEFELDDENFRIRFREELEKK